MAYLRNRLAGSLRSRSTGQTPPGSRFFPRRGPPVPQTLVFVKLVGGFGVRFDVLWQGFRGKWECWVLSDAERFVYRAVC
jgi:hypothetical protein